MRFRARRTTAQITRILILAGAFAVFLIIVYVVAGATTTVTLLVISAVFLLYFTLEQAKLGWYYEINDSSLIVRRTFKRYMISGASIARVAKTGWSGVMKRIYNYRQGSAAPASGNRQVALGRLIGFSSIPVPIRGGQPTGPDEFVILGLHDGREYVLSPAAPASFVKEVQRLMNRSRSRD